jgi:spectinomycin phosphotransferase
MVGSRHCNRGSLPIVLDAPDLAANRIVAALRRHYGLIVATLDFLPLGRDVRAWAYRATTADGAAYFVKLRRGADVHPTALHVPRFLADHGATHVVAPLPTRSGRLWGEDDAFTLTLYPFIDGVTGMTHGLRERDWAAFGAALREIHSAPLAPELVQAVPRDTFTLAQLFQRLRQAPWTDVIAMLQAHLARQNATDDTDRELAAWWQERRGEVEALVDRFKALGEQLSASRPALVLCHADIHPNNLLIDTDGRLWMVDWDEVLLAPKECDLMMAVGGLGMYPAGPRESAWFLQGYGSADVNPTALAFYRHARALGDIGANLEQVLDPNAGTDAGQTALHWLNQIFAPGYIVDLARQGV